jgi:hypothetical protein
MKISPLTFNKDVKEDILELFGKTIDEEGYIVEKENINQRVLTPKGEEIRLEEWAGIVQGSEAFVKSDTFSLMEIAKKVE